MMTPETFVSSINQVQQQMAGMKVGGQPGAGMMGYAAQGTVAAGAGGAGGWNAQQSGQTLSNNLWQW